MNTIKVFLRPSGELADVKKDFPLYKGQFQNTLLNVYVPTSILPTVLTTTEEGASSQGTTVKVGMRGTVSNGKTFTSEPKFMAFVKNVTLSDNGKPTEYALYERLLPKDFTTYASLKGSPFEMIFNVVNLDENNNIANLITTQTCALEVMQSAQLGDGETVEPTAAEELWKQVNLNAKNITLKQDKEDTSLQTTAKTVVGGINENHRRVVDLENKVGNHNTGLISDVRKNTSKIDSLEKAIVYSENPVGRLTQDHTPTTSELDKFVRDNTGRDPSRGDVVFVIVTYPNDTDKVYKYIFTQPRVGTGYGKWINYEIPATEAAGNGSLGLIQGGKNGKDTLNVDIVGGTIQDINIKYDGYDELQPIPTLPNKNAGDIAKIYSGQNSVGKAEKADADGDGNNIVSTYMTAKNGATKQELADYALPKTFNDVYFLTRGGYSTDSENGDENIVGRVDTKRANTWYTLSENTLTLSTAFELSKKNSCDNTYYINVTAASSAQLRLTTYYTTNNTDWHELSIVLTPTRNFSASRANTVNINSKFNQYLFTPIKLKEGNKIKQKLEVNADSSTERSWAVYSSSTYPSTLSLFVAHETVTFQYGKLGEINNVTFTAQSISDDGSTVLFYKGDEATDFDDPKTNTLAAVTLTIPKTLANYSKLTDNTTVGFRVGHTTVDLITPYGTAALGSLKQAYYTEDTNGKTYNFIVEYDSPSDGKMYGRVQIDDLTAVNNEITAANDNITATKTELNKNIDTAKTELTAAITAAQDETELNAAKEIVLGADGVLNGNTYAFTVQNAESYIAYRTNNTKFLIDLRLPIVGALDLTKEVAITFGDTSYYLYNILKGNDKVTIGDLKQVDKYSNASGYRFIFHATFFRNTDLTGFAVIPTISMSDVLALTQAEMDNYVTDGGLTDGQLAICTDGTAYDLGVIYKYKIVYPETYSWERLTPTDSASAITLVQTVGQSTTEAMSQKAVTDELNKKQVELTETQLAAVDSGINPEKVKRYDSYKSDIDDIPAIAMAMVNAQKGEVNGVASLDENGKVPSSQLPTATSFTSAQQAEVNAAITKALTAYMNSTEVNAAINSALANYMTTSGVQSLIDSKLSSYIKSSDKKPLVTRHWTDKDKPLTFEANTVYLVQCYDNDYNLQDLFLNGGTKDKQKAKMAIVFVNEVSVGRVDSLVIYQTGSTINITNLAGTADGATGISPSSGNRLLYFKLSGSVV